MTTTKYQTECSFCAKETWVEKDAPGNMRIINMRFNLCYNCVMDAMAWAKNRRLSQK